MNREEALLLLPHRDNGEGPEIARIERRQRAVAGELGKVDKSAEIEEGKERTFTYKVFRENTCLVDIDEEPPHTMNMEALSDHAFARALDGDEDRRGAPAHEEGGRRRQRPERLPEDGLIALDGKIRSTDTG